MEKKKKFYFIIGILIVFVMGLLMAAPYVFNENGKVIRGVTLLGVDLSGKNNYEAEEILKKTQLQLAEEQVVLEYKNWRENISFKDLGFEVDIEKTKEKIFSFGQDNSFYENWFTRFKGLFFHFDLEPQTKYDSAKLNKYLDELAVRLSLPPQAAEIVIDNSGKVEFLDGIPHLEYDKEKLALDVKKILATGKKNTVKLIVSKEEISDISAADFVGINHVLGSYTTNFALDYNRSNNINISADIINNTLLAPGEIFSFNNTTGPRSASGGYLSAPVFVNGKLEPGIGGGICQTSTTIFIAALLAGLEIVERESHFAPIGYAPLGHDATVSYGFLDLIFRNNLTHPIYLHTIYEPGSLTVYILGNSKDKPVSVELDTYGERTIGYGEVVKYDSSQSEQKTIESGHPGYEITLGRHIVRADGSEYKDSFYSYYEPMDTLITYRSSTAQAEKEEKKKDDLNIKKTFEKTKETPETPEVSEILEAPETSAIKSEPKEKETKIKSTEELKEKKELPNEQDSNKIKNI